MVEIITGDNYERATLTAREAAKFLGISYWLLLEMVKRKEIPCVKAGSRKLFRRESLERWLENKEAESIKKENQVLLGYGQLRQLKEAPRSGTQGK